MPVTQDCSPNTPVVQLALSAHQQLRHTIAGDANVEWTLETDGATTLARSPAPRTRLWPKDGDDVPANHDLHSLGMAFGKAGELHWRIEVLSSTGAVIQLVKECRYTNDGDAAEFFDSIRINLV